MKLLVRQKPQSLVSFLVPGAVFTGVEDRELQAAPSVTSDTLYRILLRKKPLILHVEFQLQRDPNMGERLWHYNALTHIHTQLPVYSVVIYLREDKPLVKSPHIIRTPDGRPTQRLDYDIIKLWEIKPEVFEQPGLTGLLPLLPLTKGGQNRKTVLRMTEKLKQVGTPGLLVVGYVCSCLVLTTQEDLLWLQERFFEMRDLLSDTWVYQEISKEGRKEGFQEGLQEGQQEGQQKGRENELYDMLIRLTTLRFPHLVSLAQQQAGQGKSPELLRTIIDKVVTAHTDQEARDALLS